MVSRVFLAALGYKPDYIVVVSDSDGSFGTPLLSGFSMSTILRLCDSTVPSIRSVAEDCDGRNNTIGRKLTELCCRLADKGFFNDPKNRRKYLKSQEQQQQQQPLGFFTAPQHSFAA